VSPEKSSEIKNKFDQRYLREEWEDKIPISGFSYILLAEHIEDIVL